MAFFIDHDAQVELDFAVLQYEATEPGLGFRFADAIDSALRLLCEYPEIAPIIGPRNTRRWVVRGFPFVLVYDVRAGDIYVIAIAHSARDPHYWRPR